MKINIRNILKYVLGFFCCFLEKCRDYYLWEKNKREAQQSFLFVKQGEGSITINHIENFKIAPFSHLKSNTFIEAWGGVSIGRYFHTGRGLTIWTSNHQYNSNDYIPYGLNSDLKPVIIEDFVWLGSNVTILPGVTIGEGAVIGACSVVTKDIPKYAVAAGNPCKVVKYRDIELFNRLKSEKKFL